MTVGDHVTQDIGGHFTDDAGRKVTDELPPNAVVLGEKLELLTK